MTSLTATDARDLMIRCLGEIAPDGDVASIPGDADFRTALDLDSMDILDLVEALSAESGAEIPDRDVIKLTTLDGAVAYLTGAES